MDDKSFEKMIGFLLGERYRLEIHWSKAEYKIEGVCYLRDAYFSGPALQIAEEIQPNNHMLLDFYKQYYIFAENVYIATFAWGNVTYNSDGTVALDEVTLSHDTELNRVPKLKNDDYLVIDTKNHEVESHSQFPTYTTIVVDVNGKAYNFWNHHGIYRKAGSDDA